MTKWEARSARRYGSQHEGFFETEKAARKFATDQILKAGDVGQITSVRSNVVYYSEYEETA